jgi:hypothetical protein
VHCQDLFAIFGKFGGSQVCSFVGSTRSLCELVSMEPGYSAARPGSKTAVVPGADGHHISRTTVLIAPKRLIAP